MTTPADELKAAARRCRSGMLIARADLDPLLAKWLDAEAKKHTAAITAAANVWGSTGHPDAIAWLDTGAGQVSPHALAVARVINTGGQP